MRICFISKEYPPETGGGGIGTHLEALTEALAVSGNLVVVLSSTNKREPLYSFQQGVHVYRIPYPKYRYTVFNRIIYAWNVRKTILALIVKHHIQIIEVPEYGNEGLFLGLMPPPIPFVVRLHMGTFLLNRIRGRKFLRPSVFILSILEWISIKLADAITAPTKQMAIFSQKNLRVSDNIVVIPNAVKDLSCEHTFDSARKQVVFVGRLEKGKSPELLSKAIPEVVRFCPEVKFVFIGLDTNDGPGKTSMQDYCESILGDYGIKEKVFFLGKQPHKTVIKYMQESDVFVLPSLFEAFGIVYVEAMRCQLPVIGLKEAGVDEIVLDGQSGILVSPNNSRELADAIIFLLKNDEIRERMGKLGKDYASANFSASVVAKKHYTFYQTIIDKAKER